MAGKREGTERPGGPRGPGVPQPAPAPVPVTPAPAPATTQAPAPAPEAARQSREPRPSPTPVDVPAGGQPAPPPQAQAQGRPGDLISPTARPGTVAAQQQMAARAGVRLGAFDPRQRGNQEEQALIAALGQAPINAIGAAGAPIPPSIGFQPRLFEDEQRILGALGGR